MQFFQTLVGIYAYVVNVPIHRKNRAVLIHSPSGLHRRLAPRERMLFESVLINNLDNT
jgi:hypothetical protein